METRWRSVCQGAIALLSSKSSAAETCYEGRVGWVQREWRNEGIEWVQEKWNPLKSSLISSALLRGVPSVWVCVSILDYFDRCFCVCVCVCVWLEKWLRKARDNECVSTERETIAPQDIPFFLSWHFPPWLIWTLYSASALPYISVFWSNHNSRKWQKKGRKYYHTFNNPYISLHFYLN